MTAPAALRLNVLATLYDAKLNFQEAISHRGTFLLWIFTDLTGALISLGVWLAVSESAPGCRWVDRGW